MPATDVERRHLHLVSAGRDRDRLPVLGTDRLVKPRLTPRGHLDRASSGRVGALHVVQPQLACGPNEPATQERDGTPQLEHSRVERPALVVAVGREAGPIPLQARGCGRRRQPLGRPGVASFPPSPRRPSTSPWPRPARSCRSRRAPPGSRGRTRPQVLAPSPHILGDDGETPGGSRPGFAEDVDLFDLFAVRGAHQDRRYRIRVGGTPHIGIGNRAVA